MDTDFGLLPEPPTEKVSSDDPYAFKLFDSGNENAELLDAPPEGRLAPHDYKIFDDASDNASWLTEYAALLRPKQDRSICGG